MSKPSPCWVVPPSPPQLIVSVPFLWEEKPGKPLSLLLLDSSSTTHQSVSHKWNESFSEDGSSWCEDWYSLSDIDGYSSISSLATRNASIDISAPELLCPLLPPPPDAGLGFLFPSSPPSAGFLDRVCRQDGTFSVTYHQESSTKGWREDCGLMTKRTLTLGELILLSRKLSYRRKQVDDIKKRRFTMKFIRESLLTCFSLRATSHMDNVAIISL